VLLTWVFLGTHTLKDSDRGVWRHWTTESYQGDQGQSQGQEQALDRQGVQELFPTLLSFFFVFVFFHISLPLIIFNWISEEVLTTHHTHSTSCFCLYAYHGFFSLFTRFNLLFSVAISIGHWIVFSQTMFNLLLLTPRSEL
jgi:hypothetical protein